MTSVLNLWNFRGERFGLTLRLLGGKSLITRARNTLVANFLDKKEATHLLFIDADIGFDPAQVERMLKFDADIVAGMYPTKAIDWDHIENRGLGSSEPLRTAGLSYVGIPHQGAERMEREGFVSGIYAGTGFMLIKRQTIETMIKAYPQLKYQGIHGGTGGIKESPSSYYALFDCSIDADTGKYLSEDYTFCQRWTAVGGEIWLDTVGKLTHVGFGVFTGDPAARFAAMAGEDRPDSDTH